MDIETLLYQKLGKYGDELTQVISTDLYIDINDLVSKLKLISGFENICDKMLSFLIIKEFSKDEIVDVILKAIYKIERI